MVGLTIDGKEKVVEEDFDFRKSQGLLPLIEKTIKDEGIRLNDLTEINVNVGPGSFTGLRVGVAVANILASVLNIPINSQPLGKLAEPIYE